MKSHKDIYSKIRNLVSKVEHSSPILFNFGLGYSFDMKLKCLEIMQRYILHRIQECFDTAKEERKNSILLKDTGRLLNESIAFFEAYLNAFYSFLQIIAKVTPVFYDRKKLSKPITDRDFGSQIDHFKKNPDIDDKYSSYLKNEMRWYKNFIDNRNAITHNVSAFLGFGKEEMEFIDMPEKRIDFFKTGKPTKKLEKYILDNWNSLFEFLNFYAEHFSKRQIFVDREEELEEIRRRTLGKRV